MTKKMYDNFQEKYKNNVFQISKTCKIRTLELIAILILIWQLGKETNTLGYAVAWK